jgi:radical SAM superfamily enzyme YgiQ (UPF0313 family)
MKIHLIFPPLWECDAPYSSIPYLYAFLKTKGFDISAVDLNIKFQNKMLTRNAIMEHVQKLKDQCEYESNEKQGIIKKALAIYELVGAKEIENAKQRLKISNDIRINIRDKKVLEIGRFIYSAKYYPASFNSYQYLLNGKEINKLSDVLGSIKDLSTNIFGELTEDYVKENSDYDVVGISVASNNQLITALTVAKMYKMYNQKVKVVIGGAILPYMIDAIHQTPEIFQYVDCFIVGEGETPLLKWLKYISGKCPIEDVPNTIYMGKDNKIYSSDLHSFEDINQLPTPDYGYVDWDDYFSSKRIISYLSSRGCYWNKCTFCGLTSNFGQKYRLRNINMVIDDIKKLKHENNTSYLIFNDEALSANRIEKISEEIIKEDIRVYWCCLCRLDNNHEKRVFEKAFCAGLRIVSFGLENGSQDVLNLMDKGICLTIVPQILKESHESGIWNNVYLILGFPGERESDISSTTEIVIENRDYIDTLGYGEFRLDGYSKVFKEPKKYGISIQSFENDYFGPNYSFTYHNNKSSNKELIEAFEACMNKYKFNPRLYTGIDLNMLLINLSKSNKNDLIKNNIEPMKDFNEIGDKILNFPLHKIKVKLIETSYKKLYINDGYSFIFYSKKLGGSIELAGDLDRILLYISADYVNLQTVCNRYCNIYNITISQIEGFVRTVVYHFFNMQMVEVEFQNTEEI